MADWHKQNASSFLTKQHAEGRLTNQNESTLNANYIPQTPFYRMIVLDVISDPSFIDEETKNKWRNELRVSNIDYIDILARNTIIAQVYQSRESPVFLFPFFPSHLALPCKAGEMVWAIYENPESVPSRISKRLGYWMCKIAQPHFMDDVNHTHPPRIHESSFTPTLKQLEENDGEVSPWYELRNGPVSVIEGTRSTVAREFYLDGPEDIFERIVTGSLASSYTNYEAIPRFRKRPGDIAFEGSNNSLIVLGTDRKADIHSDLDIKQDAGSIDMVVGRGQIDTKFGSQISTTQIFGATETEKGAEIKKELEKYNPVPDEGDMDLVNDRSRILLSQRTKVDANLGIIPYNDHYMDPKVEDSPNGDAAIIIKSDKVRIMARSDVEILVTNFTEDQSPTDKTIKIDSDQINQWASIVIKTNGDIVLRPSDLGYIRLGSDDADKAILCTDKPAILNNGSVTFPPGIVSTGASVVGTGKTGQGTFAKKVLVK